MEKICLHIKLRNKERNSRIKNGYLAGRIKRGDNEPGTGEVIMKATVGGKEIFKDIMHECFHK